MPMPIPFVFNKPCTEHTSGFKKDSVTHWKTLKILQFFFLCIQSENRKTSGRCYKRVNIYLKCYLYFIELAEKDCRRQIMSEGFRRAGSHPTVHKGQCLDRWFNDSSVCRGARDQVDAFRAQLEQGKNVMWCLLSPLLTVWWSLCHWFWFVWGHSFWKQEPCLPSLGSSVFWGELAHQICIEPQLLSLPHPSEGAWTSAVVHKWAFPIIP